MQIYCQAALLPFGFITNGREILSDLPTFSNKTQQFPMVVYRHV